jgi:hypothetical protein
MNKPELMKLFEAAFDDAIRTRMWGEITILFKDGKPAVIRHQKTTVLEGGSANGHNHAFRHQV